MKSGGDPDEIVRRQLGFRKDQDLSDPQLEYVEKVKTKLVKVGVVEKRRSALLSPYLTCLTLFN